MSGTGLLLALVQVGEWFAVTSTPSQPPQGFLVGVLSSAPFVLWLVYGGYWAATGDLSADRYPRLGAWTVGGLGVFLLMNVAIMATVPPASLLETVSWVRWASAIGGGVGLLVGVFEARAIDRQIAVERSRARRREVERQNERLEQFASVVSHDMRNPLNVAFANLDRARSEYDSEYLEAAWRALTRLDEVVEETLTLARSGRTIGEFEPVNLSDLAAECWRNVDTAGATVEIDDPGVVRGDPDRLRHLFENLFRNSVEHGSTGSRTSSDDSVEHGSTGSRSHAHENSVEHGSTSSRTASDDSVEHGSTGSRAGAADVEGDTADDGTASDDEKGAHRADVTVRVGPLDDGFYVEDDGPGIPPDERSAVLEVGYTTADEGSGLGLAIVRQIVEAHGWSIRVTDAGADGGGARFEVTGVDHES